MLELDHLPATEYVPPEHRPQLDAPAHWIQNEHRSQQGRSDTREMQPSLATAYALHCPPFSPHSCAPKHYLCYANKSYIGGGTSNQPDESEYAPALQSVQNKAPAAQKS
jgi:hypothetical protein